MDPIRIDDPRDSRVAAYLDIRERDLAGRQGRFVAEGKVVLDLLLSSGRFGAESILVLENRLDGLEDILHKAPADLPVYIVTSAVMDAIAGFHMHRGILAIGRKETPQAAGPLLDALSGQALVVVLVGIANHDNMGSIFRNAAAFGADAVLMDATCCDPLYRKAIRDPSAPRSRSRLRPSPTRQALRRRSPNGVLNNSPYRRAEIPTYATQGRPSAWRSISAPRAKACQKACWRACKPCGSPCRKASTA
ncbi:hypothetical protein ACVILI_005967 [Mesorhizobium sp. USDA 4775]